MLLKDRGITQRFRTRRHRSVKEELQVRKDGMPFFQESVFFEREKKTIYPDVCSECNCAVGRMMSN